MHERVEEELSSQYHQPLGVEQFGLEAVPAHLKTIGWVDIYLIVVNFLINPATILIGGMSVAAGLTMAQAMVAQVSGCLSAFLAYVVIATIGVDYGIPGQLAARMSFGIRGAKVGPSVLRVLASTYWFAFQTIAGALVIVDLLNRITGWNLSAVPVCVLFGLAQVVVAVWGYGWLKVLSRIAFPIKITLLIFLVSLLIRSPQPDFHLGIAARFNHASAFRWALFAQWANGMAAGWIVMITDAADFCRYSRSRAHMWFGTILAAVTGCSFCTFLGAYAAAATKGTNPNFFLVVTALEHSPIVLAAVFVVVILDNWTINVLNLYTGGLSLTNVFEKLGRFWATLIVGVFSITLSAAPHLVQGYLRYTTALGNLFAPIAGVMLADYLVIRRMRIDVAALFERGGSYWYLMGFNPAAVLTIVAGFWFTTWLPDSSVPTILVVALSGWLYPVVYKIFDKTSGVDTADIQFQEE